jgi:hypothetical protein
VLGAHQGGVTYHDGGNGQGLKKGKDDEDEDMEGDFQYGQSS